MKRDIDLEKERWKETKGEIKEEKEMEREKVENMEKERKKN